MLSFVLVRMPTCPTCFMLHPQSHPCLFPQSVGHPLPAIDAVLTAPLDAEGCYKDANVNQNMCGPTARATCTGSHGLGECCSAAGWCGATAGHCGGGMMVEYSHSNGLCESELMRNHEQQEEEHFDAETTLCVYTQQVANAWVNGVMHSSETDAQTLCVPAVIVAAGYTFDVDEQCPNKFALKKESPRTDGQDGFNQGLWAVSMHCPCPGRVDPIHRCSTALAARQGRLQPRTRAPGGSGPPQLQCHLHLRRVLQDGHNVSQ